MASWSIGIAVSVLVHVGAGAGLLAALQPAPVEDQPAPESRLNVEAHQVERSTATERTPASDPASARETEGTALGVGAIPQSAASAVAPPVDNATAQDAATLADVAPALSASGVTAAARPPEAVSASPSPMTATAAKVTAPAAQATAVTAPTPVIAAAVLPKIDATAQPSEPTVQTAALSLPATFPASPQAPPSDRLSSDQPDVPRAQTADPDIADAPSRVPDATAAAQRAPEATNSTSLPPPRQASAELAPDVTSSKAVLAFPAEGNIDPQSLSAFQSFMGEASADGENVRDSVSAALDLPCARMQVIFDPDTTTLQVTGHVPDPAQRAPVLAALQAQMGADIAVTDNLLVLPAPQCGALTGIADVGLPQSTNQITDARIIGADTHARAFRYIKDQPLVIEMTGPDYPAYVYLDYFDAGGNVIHLTPNDRAPLERVPAKGPITIGARSAGEPGLFVKIGPPYGQEIAAAFAASVPLYDGLRPLVEPADAYLAWMRERVAAARAANPDFKGEWVYFFVTTAPE